MRKYAEDNFDWDYVMCDLIKKIKEQLIAKYMFKIISFNIEI